MAQSSQALRTRIKSVNSTKKITKAMEMIANAKLFRQRHRMENNREYAQRLQDTVNEIVYHNPDCESSFLKKTTGVRTFTIIFCSDLGLCGGYNANVMNLAKTLDKTQPVFLVGTSLYRQMKEFGFNMKNEYPVSSDKISFLRLKDIIDMGVEMYKKDEVDKVQLLYTRFVNTMTFRPDFDLLLPCELEITEPVKKEGVHQETLFEPNPETILEHLIPMMIQDVAYADWMESTTAEQGSRRVAMKTASDNADDLSSKLLLEYNKIRQATITQEITEIVGGSNAV